MTHPDPSAPRRQENLSPSAVWAVAAVLLGLMALIGWVAWLVLA